MANERNSYNRDVYGTYRFWVEIDGVTEGAFSECAGLNVETELFEWQEGGCNNYTHRLPVRIKFTNLTLKRGIATADLWQWYAKNFEGKFDRRTFSIILYGYAGVDPIRWNVREAFPVKWVGPTLKADANETAVESIEIAHHGFERVNG